VQFHTENANWVEFWVMWRRMAGGLAPAQHTELWAYLRPVLERRLAAPREESAAARPKGIQPEGLDEMVRAAASLEHLPAEDKAELGRWVSARLEPEPQAGGPWTWALGRLGARAPLYGSGHQTVEPKLAEEWLRLLLRLGLPRLDGAPFAVAQLARRTGDRTRDLDEEARLEAARALRTSSAPERWVRMVEEVVVLEAQDEARALGDTLPAGLSL
jgi:hypothetical protein